MTLESYLNGRWLRGEGVEDDLARGGDLGDLNRFGTSRLPIPKGRRKEWTMPSLSSADDSVSPPLVDIPHDYNAAHDLIERNLAAGRGEKIAYHDLAGSYTYRDLRSA